MPLSGPRPGLFWRFLAGGFKPRRFGGVGPRRASSYSHFRGASRAGQAAIFGQVPGAANRLSRDERIRYGARALDQFGQGLRMLPIRTKVIAGAATAGAFWWMHRNKREKFYTRYYNY